MGRKVVKPLFDNPLHVGQLNFPNWEKAEKKFRKIFDNKYYTNHGPMVRELEEKLAEYLGVKHVVAMTNATIGLMIAAKALDVKGQIICPSFTFLATAQSLSWAGAKPFFCDVEIGSHCLDTQKVLDVVENNEIGGILGVHLWGNTCNVEELEKIARQKNIPLYFDAAHAFGCTRNGVKVGSFGSLEVFSFHATKILNAGEGGCVCTNDDFLAKRLRNIRSSYGAGEIVEIPFTGNGRMSEIQAAMALMSLEDIDFNITRNKNVHASYARYLGDIRGLKLLMPSSLDDINNFQYVVIEIDKNDFGMSRDSLVQCLVENNIMAKKYFAPPVHLIYPFYEDSELRTQMNVTNVLSEKLLQLPSGSFVDELCVEKICTLIGSLSSSGIL